MEQQEQAWEVVVWGVQDCVEQCAEEDYMQLVVLEEVAQRRMPSQLGTIDSR